MPAWQSRRRLNSSASKHRRFFTAQLFIAHRNSILNSQARDLAATWLIMIDRRAFYEQRAPLQVHEAGRGYRQLLKHYYAFYIPPGKRVLELGCGLGDLLAKVNPARGLGVDFSGATIALARMRHP